MSYRKKHYPPKLENPPLLADPKYCDPGEFRSLYTTRTTRLTSGLPYQRPVNPKEVERLIREWDERLLDPIIVSFRRGLCRRTH